MNGDFVVIEGSPEHPIPSGVYRVFTIPVSGEQIIMAGEQRVEKQFIIVPLFDGPFEIGMFPYMVNQPYPIIKQLINKIHIEAEINN
jgi:hypothetical protein